MQRWGGKGDSSTSPKPAAAADTTANLVKVRETFLDLGEAYAALRDFGCKVFHDPI